MNCESIDALLDEHAVGTLSAAARSEVDGHLASCGRCADAWLAHEALQNDAAESPRAGLLQALMATAESPAAAPAQRFASRRVAAGFGLAAAAATVALLTGLWRAETSGDGILQEARQTDVPVRIARQSVDDRAALGATPTRFTPDVPGLIDGVHYVSLAVPAPTEAPAGNIEVCGFFMFGCRHCFEFETQFVAWSDAQPDNVSVVRVPVMFNATARLHAQAFYTAEALGVLDTLIEPFYEEIHVRGNPLASQDSLREFFGRNGIGAVRFAEVFGSAEVAAKVRQAEALNRSYQVTATPSIGVNGRYLTSPSLTGSTEAMLDVVDELVESEAENCNGADTERCPIGRAPRGDALFE